MKLNAIKGGSRSSGKGFTLVEVMIVIVIVGVLVSIALPAYQETLQKGRRNDATGALIDVLNRQEQFMLDRNVYATDFTSLGYADNPYTTPEGYYEVARSACSPASVRCFTLTATPVATELQAKDTRCTSFILGSNGSKTATGTTAALCWQ